MWFWWFILICDCLIPAIMIIAGRMMWKHCPKKINGVVGYRTKMSMINMDTWRFAHDHAGKLWWKVGIGLLGPTMLIHIPFYGASDDTIGILSIIIIVIQLVKERIEGGANEKAVWRLFINCPFVCINFDFFWLNKARQLYMDF